MTKELISTNPAMGYKEVGRIPISTKQEIEAAVKKSKDALPKWRALSTKDRAQFFEVFLTLFRSKIQDIAKLQTAEMGKTLTESLNECRKRAEGLESSIARAIQVLQPQIVDDHEGYQVELHFEPHGVVGVIIPWNSPTSQFLIAVGQTLLAGNTIVMKHSEETPLTSKLLSETMHEAGFPPGVFTCLYGDGEVGRLLIEQDIDLIQFTGSTQVGEELYKKAAEKFIPAILEMGGSSPGIVFDDIDLEDVCLSVFQERFNNNGQVCCALKRLIVHESIHDQIVQKLTRFINEQVVGDPMDDKTTLGSLAAKRQLDLLENQVADAREKGAKIITGGQKAQDLDGAYFLPTLITDTRPDMKVVTEEVFGPVLPIIPFNTEAEAIKIANDTPFGLSAYVYTNDTKRGDRIARQLEAGQVSINGHPYVTPNSSFGGYKRSGIGRNKGDIGFVYVTKQKIISRPKTNQG
jgi:acyl-CoA reductase-like NAD-dependent aldehyde dehydrogenase